MIGRAIALLIIAVLSACGGGGGGSGGGGNGGGFLVHADKTALTFDYVQGAAPTAQVIQVTWTGTPPSQIFVGATLAGGGLSPIIPIAIGQGSATASFEPLPDLPAGRYSGVVQVAVCSDQACAQAVGGTPIPVSYVINVSAPVFSGPPSLHFNYIRWTTPPSQVVLSLNAAAGAWTATASDPWILLSSTSGTGAAQLSVGINTAAATMGHWTGTVTVTGANATQSSTVIADVVEPLFNISPVSFSGVNGSTIAAQSASIAVSLPFGGDISLPMTASTTTPWLRVSAATPTASNLSPGSLTLSVDPSIGALASGLHSGLVALKFGGPQDYTTISLGVALNLSRATFQFSPQPLLLGGTLGREFGAMPLAVSLNTDVHSFNWTAASTVPWATLDRTSGTVNGSGQVVQVTPQRLQSTVGVAAAGITFNAQVNGDLVTQVLPVNFTLDAHRLIAAQDGVALVDLPGVGWDRLTQAIRIRDNFGLNTAWTATSDQPWLTVTPAGQAGGMLNVSAAPAGLATDQFYSATVTLQTTDASVAGPERIRVGFWVGSSVPSATLAFNAKVSALQSVVGDPIRPIAYAYELGSPSIRRFNVYTGQELAPLTGLPANLSPFNLYRDMIVSSDGQTLFIWERDAHALVPIDLVTGSVGTPIVSPVQYSTVFDHFKYTRLDGVAIVFDNAGDVLLASSGESVGSGYFTHFGLSGDGSLLFSDGTDVIDYSSGTRRFSRTSKSGIPAFTLLLRQASNFDGSRVYAMPDSPGSNVPGQILAGNGLTATALGAATSGSVYYDLYVTSRDRLLFTSAASAGAVGYLRVLNPDFTEPLPPTSFGAWPGAYNGVLSATGDGNFAIGFSPDAVLAVPLTP